MKSYKALLRFNPNDRNKVKRGFQIYLMLAFLAATLLSPLPYSAIALALLLFQAYLYYRPLRAPLELVATFTSLIILPLMLEPVLGLFAAFLVIPAIPLLDFSLKENAPNQSLVPLTKERCATITMKSLVAALVIVFTVSVLLANWTLTATSGLFLIYITGIFAYVLRNISGTPLETSQTQARIIAGNTTKVAVSFKNRAKLSLHVFLNSPYTWLHLKPSQFILSQAKGLEKETKIDLSLSPPLAGPSLPSIEALLMDSRGLIQTRQIVKPVNLFVIPRARYAEWLARKYLEETASRAGAIASTLSFTQAQVGPRQGIEYYDSRPYQPGDRLKDIDWKHTVKLQELVVKEHIEDTRQMAIMAVNLVVEDDEQADKLVYSLITSALTLARGAIPTALAAYGEKQVAMETIPLDPRETVKKTLELGQRIVASRPMKRYLEFPDLRRIKASLRRLEKTTTGPAQRLRELLEFESKGIQEGAKDHPATKALLRVATHTFPPTLITVISAWNHDSEALSLTLAELQNKGYNATIIKIS